MRGHPNFNWVALTLFPILCLKYAYIERIIWGCMVTKRVRHLFLHTYWELTSIYSAISLCHYRVTLTWDAHAFALPISVCVLVEQFTRWEYPCEFCTIRRLYSLRSNIGAFGKYCDSLTNSFLEITTKIKPKWRTVVAMRIWQIQHCQLRGLEPAVMSKVAKMKISRQPYQL